MHMVVIGAGSLTHMPALLQGIKDVEPLTLGLVDPDIPMAELIAHAARRLMPHAGVTVTANRRDVLLGADVVVFQAAVLGEAAWDADKALLTKAGLVDQIRDMGGLSGMLYGLRTAGLVRAVCADMLELCPSAWLVCASEPIGCAVQAATQMGIAALGVLAPEAEPMLAANTQAVAVGLPHFRWLVQAKGAKGDALPALREAVSKGQWGALKQRWLDWYDALAYGSALGHAQFLHGQPDIPALEQAPLLRDEAARTQAIKHWAQVATHGEGAAFSQLVREAPRLPSAAVAKALCGGESLTLPQLVMPNRGSLMPLADSAVVAVPGRIARGTVSALATFRLPEGIADLCADIAATTDALAQAAGGDLGALRAAIELDPALAGCDRLFAQEVAERMLQANAPLLPAFSELIPLIDSSDSIKD